MDVNAAWRIIRETLDNIANDRDAEEDREDIVWALRNLADWFEKGGAWPEARERL